ncbi:MAG: hypothetical protein R3B07_37095 [Polyangiaceae bacterium]
MTCKDPWGSAPPDSSSGGAISWVSLPRCDAVSSQAIRGNWLLGHKREEEAIPLLEGVARGRFQDPLREREVSEYRLTAALITVDDREAAIDLLSLISQRRRHARYEAAALSLMVLASGPCPTRRVSVALANYPRTSVAEMEKLSGDRRDVVLIGELARARGLMELGKFEPAALSFNVLTKFGLTRDAAGECLELAVEGLHSTTHR